MSRWKFVIEPEQRDWTAKKKRREEERKEFRRRMEQGDDFFDPIVDSDEEDLILPDPYPMSLTPPLPGPLDASEEY